MYVCVHVVTFLVVSCSLYLFSHHTTLASTLFNPNSLKSSSQICTRSSLHLHTVFQKRIQSHQHYPATLSPLATRPSLYISGWLKRCRCCSTPFVPTSPVPRGVNTPVPGNQRPVLFWTRFCCFILLHCTTVHVLILGTLFSISNANIKCKMYPPLDPMDFKVYRHHAQPAAKAAAAIARSRTSAVHSLHSICFGARFHSFHESQSLAPLFHVDPHNWSQDC
jgi:hypothetical protein